MRAGFPRMVHLEMSHSGEVRQEKAREELRERARQKPQSEL